MNIAQSPWLDLFDEVHRIFVGVGSLLRDADRLMAKHGYKTAHGQNTAGTETSYHMDQPNKWMAGWFVRFYKHEKYPPTTPYVAVFLHDRGGTEDYPAAHGERLREPLVIAGVIRSASEKPCNWSYWHCKTWFWHREEGAETAQVVHDAENRDGQASNTSFAVRLEEIGGLVDLDRLVVERLVKLAHV